MEEILHHFQEDGKYRYKPKYKTNIHPPRTPRFNVAGNADEIGQQNREGPPLRMEKILHHLPERITRSLTPPTLKKGVRGR